MRLPVAGPPRCEVDETFGPRPDVLHVSRVEVSGSARGAEGNPVIHLVLLSVRRVIYVACEWFVNAVEWLGGRLEVGPIAVGTILAAFGTALPGAWSPSSPCCSAPAKTQGHRRGRRDGRPAGGRHLAYGVTGWMILWLPAPTRSRFTPCRSARALGHIYGIKSEIYKGPKSTR